MDGHATREDLHLRIRFDSDWHVGTGQGRPGDLDRLVQRDADGLPCVPAKTLTGVWRDACERLAFGLDDGQADGPWQALVSVVFGGLPAGDRQRPPRPAALSVRPLRLPPSLREALAAPQRQPLRDACTTARPGVRIDPETGQAQKDMFRLIEVARAGLQLQGDAALVIAPEARQPALALLTAGAAWVERLGGNRRRGMGRCELTIEGRPLTEAVDVLERSEPPTSVAFTETGLASVQPAPASVEGNGSGALLELRMAAQTPVLAAERTVGNVVESLDYIPGRMLLPGLARALASVGCDAAKAIADGSVVMTDALPTVEGQRARPTPSALAVEKGKQFEEGYRNALVKHPESQREEDPDNRAERGRQYKAVRGGWIAHPADGGPPRRSTTAKVVTAHSVIDDARQRPTEETGGLYVYEAIAAGTELRAEVRLAPDLAGHAERLAHAMAGPWEVGRSRKDDYGLVDVASRVVDSTADDPASETSPDGHTDELTVWLLSDMLLLDEGLRPHPTVDELARQLSSALRVEVRPRRTDHEPHGPIDASVWTRRAEGWQTRWGLPRPSLAVLGAGSCAVFETEPPVPNTELRQLERDGLGERRAEGLGRLRINDPLLTQPAAPAPKARAAGAATSVGPAPGVQWSALEEPQQQTAAALEKAAWRAVIRDAAERIAASAAQRKEKLGWRADAPPNAQLGGLQGALTNETALDAARQWFKALNKRPNRVDKWPKPALQTLQELLKDPNASVWGLLELEDSPELRDATLREDDAELKSALAEEAATTLLLAAIRQHRRQGEGRTIREETS